jgi:hypothetical protein
MAQATAPILDSTFSDVPAAPTNVRFQPCRRNLETAEFDP